MRFPKTSQSFFLLPFILLVSIVANLSPERSAQFVTDVRTLAPLRVVVSREIEVFEYQRVRTHAPRLFLVHESLECGHVYISHLWDFNDLVNGYTDSAHVASRRHRCHECRDLAAAKKPVQSVCVDAVAVTA